VKFSELVASEEYEDGTSPVVWALQREMIDMEIVARLSIPGEPASKARPRFNGQQSTTRAFTPAKTREAEEIIGWHFRKACPGWGLPDPAGQYGVIAKFFAGNHQRRDVDNMIKLVLDAFNKVIWADDSQVSEVSGCVQRGVDEPSTEIIVYRTWKVVGTKGSPSHDCTCQRCGKVFRTYASWGDKKKFCSRSCGSATLWESRTKPCPGCGKPFRESPGKPREFCSVGCRSRGTLVDLTCDECSKNFSRPRSQVRAGTRAFCDVACQATFWRKRRAVNAKGACSICGAPTSKKTYKRCNGCKLASTQIPGEVQS
jgi:Holliday junction resolvase RusA-like endonuclease